MYSRHITIGVVLLVAVCVQLATLSCSQKNNKQSDSAPKKEPNISNNLPLEDNHPAENGSVKRNDIVASIVIEPSKQIPGEYIQIQYKVENRSDQPITIWNCGFWPNHQIIIMDQSNSELPLTEKGLLYRQTFQPHGTRKKNIPVVIKPKESHSVVIPLDLTSLYQLTPGDYILQVIYEDHYKPTPLTLRAEPVYFTIGTIR